MKKVFSLILAGLLVVGMAVASSASNIEEEDRGNIAFDIHKINGTWTPDGEWTEGEYAKVDVKNTWISSACADDTNDDTAKNLPFTLGMSYDENYVYTYIQFVDPNGHNNTYDADPGSMWQAGAVQVNFSDVGQSGDQRLEYGVGVSSDTGAKLNNTWADYLGTGYVAEDADWTCDVDGDTVTYEIRTPFSAFSAIKGAEGKQITVCYVISWGNDADYAHTQLAAGCTGFGKEASYFATVTLGDQIVVETEPEVVETVAEDTADATTEAPKTFDAGIIAAVAAIVSAAGYAISKKH